MDPRNKKQNLSRIVLVFTSVLVAVLYKFVPYGQLILYPFTLLSTWIHEMGHGITALLCGGHFEELKIYSNAAGVASISTPSSFSSALASMGGLLAPPFWGMISLVLARAWARFFLGFLGISMLLSLVFWVRSLTGVVTVLPFSIFLCLVAIYGNKAFSIWVSQFLGIVLVLFTIVRIDYLFMPNAPGSGNDGPSDIAHIADVFGGPYQLWGIFLAILSFIFLIFGLWMAWKSKNMRISPRST